MDLVQLKNRSYIIKNSTNIGVYMFNDEDCLLIDTSYPGKTAEKLLKFLKAEGLNVKYIINTHGHIDHFGANELLAENFSLEVFASAYEKTFIKFPDSTHSFLTAAKPISALATGLDGMEVNEIKGDYLNLENNKFKIINLPGHSRSHIGILTEDKVLYGGDAMLAPSIIEQIKIPYFYDIEKFRESILKIEELSKNNNMDIYVPSHGNIIKKDFSDAVKLNLNKVEHLLNLVLDILKEKPLNLEKIIEKINIKFNITEGIPNHFITRACIMSFLSYFIEKNKVETIFKDNLLHYKLKL